MLSNRTYKYFNLHRKNVKAQNKKTFKSELQTLDSAMWGRYAGLFVLVLIHPKKTRRTCRYYYQGIFSGSAGGAARFFAGAKVAICAIAIFWGDAIPPKNQGRRFFGGTVLFKLTQNEGDFFLRYFFVLSTFFRENILFLSTF